MAVHIKEILNRPSVSFSYEFFPPKTPAGAQKLYEIITELSKLKPAYVSVTYGAGGSTRELTHDLVTRIQKENALTVVSHLTCIGTSRDQMRQILERYDQSGIHSIMALAGDPPQTGTAPVSDFRYAVELVTFVKKHFPHMGVGVAGFPEGHPRSPNRLKEIELLKAKVDEGADYICTQLFFDNRDYYDFCERCELAGIRVPIIPGLMAITSRKSMERMAELSPGSRFPASLLRSVSRASSDEQV
jgi:methylenetetrahydrofolate reductase (NADPH)